MAELPHGAGNYFDALPRQKMPTLPAKEHQKIEAEA